MSHPPVGRSDLAWLEPAARADLRSFAGRARSREPGGVLRWRSGGGLLVTTVRARPGQGLLGHGIVVGMRAVSAPSSPELDAVVSLTDLVAALDAASDALPAPMPPTDRAASWVGLAPPRSGWELLGEIQVAAPSALAGSSGASGDSGAAAVDAPAALLELVRGAASWLGEESAASAAEALVALGFLTPGTPMVRVFRAGPWTRLSTAMGHVLTR